MARTKITKYKLQVYPFLLLFTLFLLSPAWASTSLQVEWRDGRLSVRAEKVSLAEILQEVARRTGMEIHGLEGVREQVSVSFASLPLHEGLQKLAVNYLIVWKTFPQQGQRPVLALVSGPRVFALSQLLPRQVIPAAEKPELEEGLEVEDAQDKRIEALHALAKQGNEEALRKAFFHDPDPAIQAAALTLLAERDRQGASILLVEATKSEKTERRLQALQLLYQTNQADEGTVLSALSHALTDEESTVRGFAIQALAAWGGTDTRGYLRQALRDPDPTVRMLALEEVAQQEDGRLLLQEALADSDEAVRALASALVSGPVPAR